MRCLKNYMILHLFYHFIEKKEPEDHNVLRLVIGGLFINYIGIQIDLFLGFFSHYGNIRRK